VALGGCRKGTLKKTILGVSRSARAYKIRSAIVKMNQESAACRTHYEIESGRYHQNTGV